METDVVIIGAGAAGAGTAHVLSDAGLSVALVDSQGACPPQVFKAEKMADKEFSLLNDLGLRHKLGDIFAPSTTVMVYRGATFTGIKPAEVYGMRYADLVNGLRKTLPREIRQYTATATEIISSADRQTVRLQKGEILTARLVVIATGADGRLGRALGLTRKVIEHGHTVIFGFDLKTDSGRLPHEAITFHSDRHQDRFSYLTLFPLPGAIRANLFTYWEPGGESAQRMRTEPIQLLDRIVPTLRSVIGNFSITSRISATAIDLWTSEPPSQPGIILVGDAFQSVCPATGTGLLKVLTDISALKVHVADWFATPGMTVDKLASYYTDPDKVAADQRSLQAAHDAKREGTLPPPRRRILLRKLPVPLQELIRRLRTART